MLSERKWPTRFSWGKGNKPKWLLLYLHIVFRKSVLPVFFWHKAVVALLFLLKLMEQSTPSAGLCKYEHSQSHKRSGSTQRPSLIVPRKCWILVTVVCVRACMSRCIHMLSWVGELADHASNPESLLWRRKLTLVWIYNQLNLPALWSVMSSSRNLGFHQLTGKTLASILPL